MRKIFYTFICLLFFIGTSFGASVILNPLFTVYVDGSPLSGGKVYTYECGTTTGKTTYTDYTGGTANANPVVLSTNGSASIFCSGCLKVLIKTSAGVTIDGGTIDNIQGFDSSVLQDADRDTKIQCEESADEDTIRFDIAGSQIMYIDANGVHTTTVAFETGYGAVRRPKFRWKDADEIYIGAGAYHHSGTSDQFVYWSSEITFELEAAGSNEDSDNYGADGWHYIYLDDSAIVTQASTLLDADCFLNETTAPTFSTTKHGWYNGEDRCIFAVYETGSAILEFFHDGGDCVFLATDVVEYSGVIGTNYADEVLAYVPGFSQKVKLRVTLEAKTADAMYLWYWRTNGQTDGTGHRSIGIERIGTDQSISGIVEVFTDTAQTIEHKAGGATTSIDLFTDGWYFPTRM